MRLKDIFPEEEAKLEGALGEIEFTRIIYRPDDAESGCAYFHIKGVKENKDAYIKDVIPKKPAVIIADKEAKIPSDAIPLIRVKNARAALAYACSRYYCRDLGSLTFVAVTGTNGKTTTASMIEKILTENGEHVGFIGTGSIRSRGIILSDRYYSMTTPDPDVLYSAIGKMESDGCRYVVMEVSSHSIALEKIAPLKFAVGVFTNLSHEHMDFHKDIEEYYKTKMRLFEKCELTIFNADDAFGRRGYGEHTGKKKSVGVLFDADVMAKEPRLLGLYGSAFLLKAKEYAFRLSLPLIGGFNVYNALCSVSAAVALGVAPRICKAALECMEAPRGRFEPIRKDITVIIDYAHTPEAMENALKTAKLTQNVGQNLLCVFGCGGDRDRSKRPIMGKIAEIYADAVILTEDNSRSELPEVIIDDILEGFTDRSRAIVINSRKDAIETAILTAPKGSTVLILGKGAESYNIDSEGYHPFNEREIIDFALKKRGGEYVDQA